MERYPCFYSVCVTQAVCLCFLFALAVGTYLGLHAAIKLRDIAILAMHGRQEAHLQPQPHCCRAAATAISRCKQQLPSYRFRCVAHWYGTGISHHDVLITGGCGMLWLVVV